MSSTNWHQGLATLDTELKRVAIEWLRRAAGNSATSNVQLNDAFCQTFLQVSSASLNAAYSIVKGETQFERLNPTTIVAAPTTVPTVPVAAVATASTASGASAAAYNRSFGQRIAITATTSQAIHRQRQLNLDRAKTRQSMAHQKMPRPKMLPKRLLRKRAEKEKDQSERS